MLRQGLLLDPLGSTTKVSHITTKLALSTSGTHLESTPKHCVLAVSPWAPPRVPRKCGLVDFATHAGSFMEGQISIVVYSDIFMDVKQ